MNSSVHLVSNDLYGDPAREIAEICVASPGQEVGGVLFGHLWAGGAEVLHVSGPGPAAVLEQHSLIWDPSYILGYLEATARFCGVGSQPVGRWHKHCSASLFASEEDRRGAEAFRRAIRAEAIVDLVVATERDRPVGWAAYLCTAEEFQRIEIHLPPSAAAPQA